MSSTRASATRSESVVAAAGSIMIPFSRDIGRGRSSDRPGAARSSRVTGFEVMLQLIGEPIEDGCEPITVGVIRSRAPVGFVGVDGDCGQAVAAVSQRDGAKIGVLDRPSIGAYRAD